MKSRPHKTRIVQEAGPRSVVTLAAIEVWNEGQDALPIRYVPRRTISPHADRGSDPSVDVPTQDAPRRILCHRHEAQIVPGHSGRVEGVPSPAEAISDPPITEEEQPMPSGFPMTDKKRAAIAERLRRGETFAQIREAEHTSAASVGRVKAALVAAGEALPDHRRWVKPIASPAAEPVAEVGVVDSAATHAPCDACGNLTRIGIDCRCNARKVPKGSPVVTACGSPSPETREHLAVLGRAVADAVEAARLSVPHRILWAVDHLKELPFGEYRVQAPEIRAAIDALCGMEEAL